MWRCSACSEMNDDIFSFCCSCGAKRPEPVGGGIGSGTGGGTGGGTDGGSDGEAWTCSCGMKNDANFLFCIGCGKPKPKIKKDPAPKEWHCKHCGVSNSASSKFCANCGKPRNGGGPIPKAWIIAIAAVLLAAIIVTAVILIVRDNRRKTYPTPTWEPTATWSSAPAAKPTPSYEPAAVQPAATVQSVSTPTPMPMLDPVKPPQSNTQWGAWSSWSTSYVSSSSTREVQTDYQIIGYNMVHYGTQQADKPYYRVFRNYSIGGDYSRFNARSSYGEKHVTRYVEAWLLDNAIAYPPSDDLITPMDPEEGVVYAGYQHGDSMGYYFGDDKYVYFIESPVYAQVYRYRDAIR